MNKSSWENVRNVVAGIQTVLGAALFVAPWLLGFAAEANAAWTAWITGAVIGALGLATFAEDITWPAWGNLVVGAWAVAAPWLVQFAELDAAMWSHVAVGLLVAVSSIWELFGDQNLNPRVTA